MSPKTDGVGARRGNINVRVIWLAHAAGAVWSYCCAFALDSWTRAGAGDGWAMRPGVRVAPDRRCGPRPLIFLRVLPLIAVQPCCDMETCVREKV